MKTVAIILCRMASSRLPGKALLPLAGKPSLQWCYERVSAAKEVDEVVIATTLNESNNALRMVCEENQWTCFNYPQDENDCLGRVYNCAVTCQADIIVDITADCPLVDPRHIDHLVKLLKDTGYDYVSNDIISRSWCDGADLQIYTMNALNRICAAPYSMINKEHTGWNIAAHGHEFAPAMKIYHLVAPETMNWPELSLSLDCAEDWKFLEKLMLDAGVDRDKRHNIDTTLEDIIQFLKHRLIDEPGYITNQGIHRKWRDAK